MNKFIIKDNVDKQIYAVYNVISDVIFSVNFRVKNLLKKNSDYKNIHAGGRCFLLGTGPSLNDLSIQQIEKLKSEITFGVNSLYKSKVTSVISPTYYALVDSVYWEGLSFTFKEVGERYKSIPPIFLADVRSKKIIDNLELKNEVIYIYAKKYPTHKMSSELSKNMFGAMNVISYSILAAIYMGFKEIYLLGCDYNFFCEQGNWHCYDDKEEMKSESNNLAYYLKYYNLTTEFHYLIAKLAAEKGVKITNLTKVSILDAYPRRDPSLVL